jgi:hypothetical protein
MCAQPVTLGAITSHKLVLPEQNTGMVGGKFLLDFGGAWMVAASDQDYRALARDRRQLGVRAVPGQESRGAGGKAGLDHLAPVGMRVQASIGHGVAFLQVLY